MQSRFLEPPDNIQGPFPRLNPTLYFYSRLFKLPIFRTNFRYIDANALELHYPMIGIFW